MTYKDKAIELFFEGANCAQAVLAAFAPLVGVDEQTCLRLSSSFGGGIGRLREVCGAVSGMCMAAGLLYGYDDLTDPEAKKAHYARIQELCEAFRKHFGTLICRELLDKKTAADISPDPSPRTESYYRSHPCARQVGVAAEILEAYIQSHPVLHQGGKE